MYDSGTNLPLNPTSELYQFLKYDNQKGIQIYTDDLSLFGSYTIKIKAYLEKYPAIESNLAKMKLQLVTCPVLSIETPNIGEIEVAPNGKIVKMKLEEFRTTGAEDCFYTWSYEAYYAG